MLARDQPTQEGSRAPAVGSPAGCGSTLGTQCPPPCGVRSLFLFLSEPGFEQFKISERLHGNWIRLYLEENYSEALLNLGGKVRRQYLETLTALSRALSNQVAQYDIYSMVVGTVVVLEVRCSHGARLPVELAWYPSQDSAVEHLYTSVLPQTGNWFSRLLTCALAHSPVQAGGWRHGLGHSLWPLWTSPCFPAQVLALLLLSIPQALGATAELEVPLSPVCSLLFYLMFLLLWAVHVVVCTSTESARYLCNLSWPMAGGVLAVVSALLFGVLSALTRTCVAKKHLRRVRPAPAGGTRLSV